MVVSGYCLLELGEVEFPLDLTITLSSGQVFSCLESHEGACFSPCIQSLIQSSPDICSLETLTSLF